MEGTQRPGSPVQPIGGTDDDSFMARVVVRDAEAFRALADRHGSVPYRIAYRMTGDAAEAEDIAQEAFLRLWDKAPRWRAGESGVAAWLTRVAMNLSLDRLRRRRFASHEPPPERADEDPRADEAIEAEQSAAAVRAGIAALSERQRAAIVLTYYEEVPNRTAAEMLNMNLKGFESLLFRARAALRDALAAGELREGSES
jgi:RNA polymerase sigma factor (sigma-70 family)